MKKVKFSKLNGQGNDFIIIDALSNPVKLTEEQIIRMCDRNFGIGADGLIMVQGSKKADFKMDYYNRDGSIAEMCGNGIRCMVSFIHENKLSTRNKVEIETLAGIKEVTVSVKDGKAGVFKVNMGKPEFNPKKIPVNIKSGGPILGFKLTIDSKDFYVNCVSMGNPHCVIFLKDIEDISRFPLDIWGPALEKHDIFPNRTNVEFIKIEKNGELSMIVWERGVGRTLACGTGASAAGVIAIKSGKIGSTHITINVPGGSLNIAWNDLDSDVFLEGTVDYSYDGVYFL